MQRVARVSPPATSGGLRCPRRFLSQSSLKLPRHLPFFFFVMILSRAWGFHPALRPAFYRAWRLYSISHQPQQQEAPRRSPPAPPPNGLSSLPKDTAPVRRASRPPHGGDMLIQLVQGVAGSRKTQFLIDEMISLVEGGKVKRPLFLVKVGSNAEEIRVRIQKQLNQVFKRHGKTKHYYSSWGRSRKGVQTWVVTVDAFIDNQLRQHASSDKHAILKEELKKHGANWDWKRRRLQGLIDQGEHKHFYLKDGSTADFVLIDEAQDILWEEGELLVALSRATDKARLLIVGDKDQLVFDKALGHQGATFMDLASREFSVDPTRLAFNYRCPPSHIHFINEMGILESPVQPPPLAEVSRSLLEEGQQHKPYFFCAPMRVNPNDQAYRAALMIKDKVLTLFRSDPNIRLDDIAILSRYVNSNRLFMQLQEVLERALVEEGLAPVDGSPAVYLMRTKVNERKSIEWANAVGKIVMLSVAAAKGRDWKAVFLLDVNEGVLPRPTEVPDIFWRNTTITSSSTTKGEAAKDTEHIARSLCNVGFSRSRRYLFVFFDSHAPSRYLPQPQEKFARVAQLEWKAESVEEAYRKCRPNNTHAPLWETDQQRKLPLKIPFLSRHRICEVADLVPTVHAVVEGDGLVMYDKEVFASPCKVPKWWKSDEVQKRIVGVMGELMLLRHVMAKGLLVEEQGWQTRPAVSVFDLLTGEGCGNDNQEETEAGGGDRVCFTSDAGLLNLAADTQLNDKWRKMVSGKRRERLHEDSGKADYMDALKEITQARPYLEKAVQELREHPRCVLHESFRSLLPELVLLRHPHVTPPYVWWNAAILYCECFDSELRDPSLVKMSASSDDGLPEGLKDVCDQLSENARLYLEHLHSKEQVKRQGEDEGEDAKLQQEQEQQNEKQAIKPSPRHLCHGSLVSLMYAETNHEVLQRRNFDMALDREVFESGWQFGLLGKLDFYDPLRRRVVEIKCSDQRDVLTWYEVQTLVCALVRGVRAYEVVNLLRGTRHLRYIKPDVRLWPILRKVLVMLDMDDEMIEALAPLSRCYVRESLQAMGEEVIDGDIA